MSHTPTRYWWNDETPLFQRDDGELVQWKDIEPIVAQRDDLLAALKECVDCLDRRAALPEHDDRYIFLSELNIRDRARLAIAKATADTTDKL